VSPAAILGATSDKARSLEAAAHILATEVVESNVWGEAWRAHSPGKLRECHSTVDVWQADVKRVAQAFEAHPSLEGPLDIETVFMSTPNKPADSVPPSIQSFDPPMFVLGKSDAILQLLPSALRFWEKMGLGPRAGRKDVVAYVFFEDDGGARQDLAEIWLKCMSTTYAVSHRAFYLCILILMLYCCAG